MVGHAQECQQERSNRGGLHFASLHVHGCGFSDEGEEAHPSGLAHTEPEVGRSREGGRP